MEQTGKTEKKIDGLIPLFFVAAIMIIGSITYYLYALNWIGVLITIVISILVFFLFKKQLLSKGGNLKIDLILNKKSQWLLISFLLFSLASLLVVLKSRSGRPLISPWDVVDPNFFWLYGLATVSLLFICLDKTIGRGWKLIGLSFQYFLSLSVAIIVYRVGYGFDPFVHQATMELVDKQGAVWPKTPYYLGQYSLIVILHKLTTISIAWLNRFLVPGLAAICLPVALWRFLNKTAKGEEGGIWLTILFLPVLTFSPFILTTPQNLSYLFLILAVLSSFSSCRLLWPAILTMAATAVHPLAGLPALGWVALCFFKKYKTKITAKWQGVIKGFILAFIALALPLALFLVSGTSWRQLFQGASSFSEIWNEAFSYIGLSGREDWLLNLVYFFAHNYCVLLIILIIVAVRYFFRRAKEQAPEYRILGESLIETNASLAVALILSCLLHFNDLISYEQSGYANRILIIMAIFFLPFIISWIKNFIERIRSQEIWIRFAWVIFGIILLLISLYISYPRFDKYWNSRGYGTSNYDLRAVTMIDNLSDESYIVLANQQVSAAALSLLGFDHYYQTKDGLIYFYPIPTGGELYQYYLTMAYENPDRQTMFQALDLVGVDEGYLVINKYWYQSGRTINQAKLTADKWYDIDGEVYIFRYNR